MIIISSHLCNLWNASREKKRSTETISSTNKQTNKQTNLGAPLNLNYAWNMAPNWGCRKREKWSNNSANASSSRIIINNNNNNTERREEVRGLEWLIKANLPLVLDNIKWNSRSQMHQNHKATNLLEKIEKILLLFNTHTHIFNLTYLSLMKF